MKNIKNIKNKWVFLLFPFLICNCCEVHNNKNDDINIYDDTHAVITRLGVSTSAYQIEGGWDIGGRSPSVWDDFSHTNGKILDNSNGDITADHYHHWEEDIDLISWLGAGVYRFSLSWSRLLPTGGDSRDRVNQDGILFYNNIIDKLISKNITPMATLWHWDTPSYIQREYGAWEDDRVINDFGEYARVCFKHFGDRVKLWLTLNEPLTVATLGYGNGVHAPGVVSGKKPYETAHRMIRAHAYAYKIYENEFRKKQKGKVSIALNSDFVAPLDPSDPSHREAAERALLWRMGWFADPIYFGDYPQSMKDRVGGDLPVFIDPDEIKGTERVYKKSYLDNPRYDFLYLKGRPY